MADLGGATLNQTAASGGKGALIFDGAKFPRPTPILPAFIRWQKEKARFALTNLVGGIALLIILGSPSFCVPRQMH